MLLELVERLTVSLDDLFCRVTSHFTDIATPWNLPLGLAISIRWFRCASARDLSLLRDHDLCNPFG